MYQPEFFRNTSSMFKKTTVHYLSQEKKQKKGHGLMKEIYQLNKEELFRTCGNPEGLTTTDAKERLQTYGENTLVEQKKQSVASVFFHQFADLLVIILIAAAIVSMASGNIESTIVIFAVIIMNAILGTIQYVKAEKSLDSLKELSAPKAKVLRDGIKQEIASKDIVPGDILLLEAGDMIVADGRIIENFSLQVNESSLTGESTNVDKDDSDITEDVALGDRINMVFSGSLVTYGRANVLVTATGMHTEMGKIATLMNNTKSKATPLQISLDNFSKKLATIIMVISLIVFGLRLMQGEKILDSLMFAVALAVAAIPEALGSIVTIVQAMGTRKMAADQAIIKDLKAVESLGCVSVICSDKTGTLTQNKMTVQQLYTCDTLLNADQLDLHIPAHRYFLYNCILNNDSSIRDGKDIGDPTETCLLTMARKTKLFDVGVTEEVLRDLMPRLEEIPFDSERKLMSSKYLLHGVPTLLTKGAVDVLLTRMDSIITEDGIRPITENDRNRILEQNMQFSRQGLRVLALAYKECSDSEVLTAASEYGYTFIGLVSMIDPPREESMAAVADAISAGIKPIMITGDHKVTATAIARQIGIFHDGDMAVTGQEVDRMTDDELTDVLPKISVYARVSPENKIRIVDAWQKKGHIVAMTGDGVNDAPALKKADIGVAMGITGTDVTKNVADMVLADDNFATIVGAVAEGRRIYDNIRKSIQFLLASNMSEVLSIFAATMLGFVILQPVHLLWINLITDCFPALALGMERPEADIMQRKPRKTDDGIFAGGLGIDMLYQGVILAGLTLTAYFIGHYIEAGVWEITTSPDGTTMAFLTLSMAEIFHSFNMRSQRDSLLHMKYMNPALIWSSIASFAATTLVIYVPFLADAFEFEHISLTEYAIALGLAFLVIPIVEIIKFFQRKATAANAR